MAKGWFKAIGGTIKAQFIVPLGQYSDHNLKATSATIYRFEDPTLITPNNKSVVPNIQGEHPAFV